MRLVLSSRCHVRYDVWRVREPSIERTGLRGDKADVAGATFGTNINCKTVVKAMSVRKLTASLLLVLAMLGGAPASHAQEYVPVADPFAFDPDFRWFEPVYDMDLADMKPKKRAPTGWFSTYDRLNLYGSRPELSEPGISETLLDNGWGHRYEIGFMLPGKKSGWLFNWTTSRVGAVKTVRRERLNRINTDQLGGGGGGGQGGTVGPPFGEIVRQVEQNNRGHNFRFYDIADTENSFHYKSYELNKTWRMEPYHYGGILEPMVGLRWMRFRDINGFQVYNSALDTDQVPYLVFPNAERIITNSAVTRNEMFGGQLGFRYFKYRDRFTFRGDFRAFFGGNWQSSRAQQTEEITSYDGIGTGSNVDFIIDRATDPIYSRNEEFFVGFDVRGEVGYQLTKMISVRAGFQLIDIARGLWRGGDGQFVAGGDNDQDVLLVGGTFGINLNH